MSSPESISVSPATDAPAALGALAATYAAIELRKLLLGEFAEALLGRELYIDARHHQHMLTHFTRNANCRFDHRMREVEPLAPGTLGELFAHAGGSCARGSGAQVSLEGETFPGAVSCRECAASTPLFKPRSRLSAAETRCGECGAPLEPTGFELLDALSLENVPAELLYAPLHRLGLRDHDILALESKTGVKYIELGEPSAAATRPGATVILAGCGNIGSHLVGHLARLPGLGRVVLIDPDLYEPKNLTAQDIRPGDVGRAKVAVQAERLAAIAPELEIETCFEPLEAVPMGRYRGAIAVGALDSRRARMDLNLRARRVGVPWIDTAVHGAMMLCRIGVYEAGFDAPCIECGWSDDDYAQLEQRLPCVHGLKSSADQP